MVLHTGRLGGLPASALALPGRDPQPEDERIQTLLGRPRTVHVEPEQYVPTLKTLRAASNFQHWMGSLLLPLE
jgi:hypothetical protein